MKTDRALSLIAMGIAAAIAVSALAGWRHHVQTNKRASLGPYPSERSAAAPAFDLRLSPGAAVNFEEGDR